MFTTKQITTLFGLAALFFPINGEKEYGTIYVLIWTIIKGPWRYYRNLDHEEGHAAFVSRNCSFQNCYITTNRTYFESVLGFDVLVFNAVHLSHGYENEVLPDQRSPSQLYVLFCVEPAAYNSIDDQYDGFFNLTWTYILSSDIVHPRFLIKNRAGEIIGPNIDVHWLNVKDMSRTKRTIVKELKRKNIAALWVVSNCDPKIRKVFFRSLNDELSKYGHRVDVYGRCGDTSNCVINTGEKDGRLNDDCYSKIKSDYYFYLSFENSFTEDYVSEKVLHALLHYSVPIVYGGANYTRFLPDGSYLDALELGVEGLARVMNYVIKKRLRYYDFFKWHNYYSIHDTHDDDYKESVCAFCAFLNDKTKRNETQVYENITGWWNASYPEQSGDPLTEDTTLSKKPTTFFSAVADFLFDFLYHDDNNNNNNKLYCQRYKSST